MPVAGHLCHNPILLLHMYAPNSDNPDFINILFGTFSFLDTQFLILAGDLNCVMNPTLDRSNPRTLTQSAMSKSISDFMLQNGFVDPWGQLFKTFNLDQNYLDLEIPFFAIQDQVILFNFMLVFQSNIELDHPHPNTEFSRLSNPDYQCSKPTDRMA